MGGMVSKAASSLPSGGGKSSPAPQNAYGSSYQAPAANVYQPSYQGQSAPSSGGGKSSGLGQGGYGGAPGFGGQQFSAQTQPSFEQSPYGAGPSSVNSTTTADMMGGNRGGGQGFGQVMQGLQGGKSSGLGQGGYGMAPAFQQQQFNPYQQQFGGFQQPQFNPFQQPQFNPFQQQFGGFQQQPQNINGLQGLFNAMMNQQQMPMQRQPMQQYQDPALQFRPNMQNAQSALSRVRPSVQRQQQDAQAARISELEAQLARFNTPSGE
jgi:hypothetical protein